MSTLGPEQDRTLLDFGFGFTDLVKRATATAAGIKTAELEAGVRVLLTKLERYRPRIACFQGISAYRSVHRALGGDITTIGLGGQSFSLGPTQFYVVPNPSGANAHFTRADQVRWYDNLAERVRLAESS